MSRKRETNEETLLEFPCRFPIKALGHADCELDLRVAQIIRKHVPHLGEGAVKSRPSSGGKYISVTVTITATSLAQIHAIYRELSECADVLMTL
jgi:uncharacterized protein